MRFLVQFCPLSTQNLPMMPLLSSMRGMNFITSSQALILPCLTLRSYTVYFMKLLYYSYLNFTVYNQIDVYINIILKGKIYLCFPICYVKLQSLIIIMNILDLIFYPPTPQPPHRDPPLCAYLFTTDSKVRESFVTDVLTGSMCVNDCVVQLGRKLLSL